MKDFIVRGSAVIQIKFKTTRLVQPHMPLISQVGRLRLGPPKLSHGDLSGASSLISVLSGLHQ